ncbi:manganese-binding transcriptional regulator MntR [Consotaella salsifontis]|uniref:Transcriptional regulator MntR n=1 Tax=Consotaella salsifontis TaxID=1365950 RepID=A0A1T4NLM4_9HYPH|nr:manganese-binding transcriptional regulator MntR [Consotaella salsifontis]SJZ80016.1 iron (metal) dependent repressor, DtxR family [Consotaella salsifontis]
MKNKAPRKKRAAVPAEAVAGAEQSAPDLGAEAHRFSQTRSARSAEILEDYTELIADLMEEHGEARITDIARCLGVTHPTAAKAVARLKREGLVTSRPYRGVFLTEAGAAMAERVRVRHRIVIEFLKAIGVPAEIAAVDAEGIEHYVSDATLAAFSDFVRSAPEV